MSRPCVILRSGALSGVVAGVVAGVLALSGGTARAARCPSLTIVLERSGSMLWDLAGHTGVQDPSKQRWGIAKAAIERAVATYQNKLPIGLTLFPTDDLCGSEGPVRVPPAYGTLAAITAALHASDSSPSGGGIPTCGAIRRVVSDVRTANRDAYLLLITDGVPTCDTSCGFDFQDPAGAAVNAIAQASSSIKTFVLGIGTLPSSARSALTRMADAGGVPDRNNPMLKFFSASDISTLDASLERILSRLLVDDLGTACEDSCSRTGCVGADQICVHDRCVPDPCRALACRAGEYCWSTGTAAKCAAPCDKSCPAGSRCNLGACVHDACRGACGPGTRCQPAAGSSAGESVSSGTCVPDPACAKVSCPSGQACQAGVCREDPCSFTRCPGGLMCLPFDGSCVTMSQLAAQNDLDNQLSDGCSMSTVSRMSLGSGRSSAASGVVLFFLVLLGLSWQRRRPRV